MKTSLFAKTRQGLPVFAHHFGEANAPLVLVLGGVHGDEIEGVIAARGLMSSLLDKCNYKLRFMVIPEFNPEGVLLKTRGNSAGVDLNRNLPTKDWSPEAKTPRYQPGPHAGSEPENQPLMALLEKEKPILIVSLHSWHPVLNVNGDCLAFAEKLAQLTGYKVDADIGYPTPGCLGTYTGLERNIPTLTYEIERGLANDLVIKNHVPALLEAFRVLEK